MGWRVEVVGETGSTNADLRQRALDGEAAGVVLVADHQRSGRGRLDRAWVAPERAALAVSVLLRPALVPAAYGWLPLLAGVAVTDALADPGGLRTALKWPNDVLVLTGDPLQEPGQVEEKVCGILAESVGDAVIVGAGINVTQGRDELPVPNATSLWLAGAATIDRRVVLEAYLRAFEQRYRQFEDAAGDAVRCGLFEAYRQRCLTIGREVAVHLPGGAVAFGQAVGVDAQGRLLVVHPPETAAHAYTAGDVVHLRPGASPAKADGFRAF